MKQYRVSASTNSGIDRLQRLYWRTYDGGEEAQMIQDLRDYARREFVTYSMTVNEFKTSQDKYDIPVMIILTDESGCIFNPFDIEVTLNGVLQ